MPSGTERNRTIDLAGQSKKVLETGKFRLLVAATAMLVAFSAIGVRLVDLTVVDPAAEPRFVRSAPSQQLVADRGDILDRNGIILATSLPATEATVRPKVLKAAGVDPTKAAAELAPILDKSEDWVFTRLTSARRFAYLHRSLTPRQHHAINALGIPGIEFLSAERRIYPQGRLASHLLGLTNVDGQGTAGLELAFNDRLASGREDLHLSLDIRIQAVLHDELSRHMDRFKAIGAAGLVMDVHTGEIISMVSLPDFDPNRRDWFGDPETVKQLMFNRATLGVYEMGSTFKLFTAAMALDAGTMSMADGYDATDPIRVARFTIRDFHPKQRWLSLPEIMVYSSNIGTAKMVLDIGVPTQQDYLNRLGLMQAARLELPERGVPLLPAKWREINAITIAYGHGISVSPVHVAKAVSALVNGGFKREATLLRQTPGSLPPGERVVSAETSAKVRDLMRLVALKGTGRNADKEAQGYRVGGKTGTADKLENGRYAKNKRISSFVGAFPMDNPRYVVLAVFDEPKGLKETLGYATGGWVAAPVVGRVINRMAPMVGLAPEWHIDERLDAMLPDEKSTPLKPSLTGPILPVRAEGQTGISPDFGAVTTPLEAEAFSPGMIRAVLDDLRDQQPGSD
ncbi:MAG: peptidoglycan D,D-transpeptidase FtsI family protein [Magnetovibrionaceae bacterium]